VVRTVADHRDGRCTFEVLIDHFVLATDPALARLAAVVDAADIDDQLDTDPLGPGLLAIGLGGLDVETDDHRLLERDGALALGRCDAVALASSYATPRPNRAIARSVTTKAIANSTEKTMPATGRSVGAVGVVRAPASRGIRDQLV